MKNHLARSEQPCNRNLPKGGALLVMLLCLSFVGCAQLRLPAIDPTGSCLFAPCPTSTTLSLPGCNGDNSCFCLNCLGGLGGCLGSPATTVNEGCGCSSCFRCLLGVGCCSKSQGFNFPEPAFPEPEPPPKCAQPPIGGSLASGAATDEPCVAGPGCSADCLQGPPAVLLGDEINSQRLHSLPASGERGCILLSPQKIVAPVGGEVILLSGICGTDGYLQLGQPLEWMLTPDSVGTFIQVGNDDPGMMHRLSGFKKAEKRDPSYALGVTSTKRTLITRGNNDPKDDVLLEKGQTWLSISSPSEGTSRVTVLAPESDCWDQRKATATIYWIDARAQFPSAQSVQSGVRVPLTTRVTRAEGSLPARGWKVRYEILQPELATFAETNNSAVVEAVVDESGNATVELVPVEGASGTATIDMQVIRPGGESDNMPSMTLFRGSTVVSWSSPGLAIRAGAPAVASFDAPFELVANVSNPGNQAATNVRVSVEFPPGVRAVSADTFAQVLPNGVVWEIGTIPAQTQLDLFASVAAQSAVQLTFQARADGGLISEDTVRVDIFRPALTITSSPEKERYEAGNEVTFNVDVQNTGDRPITNVQLKAYGDEGMVHRENGTPDVGNDKTDGPLQPGETWATRVTYIPTRAGRRSVRFEAIADGGQRATSESFVTVINPVPPPPSLKAELEGRDRIATTDAFAIIRARITNTGDAPLADTQVTMLYDPQLQLLQATEGATPSPSGQNAVQWSVANLAPGQTSVLEGQFRAVAPSPQSTVRLSARSRDGTSAETELQFAIVVGAPPVIDSTPAPPLLPPIQPPPSIPGGPGTPPSPSDVLPPTTTPPPSDPLRSNRVEVEIFGRDNPVRVGEPIRYTLRVTNDSSEIDGEVSVRFNLPSGVKIERVVQRRSPVGGQYEIKAGQVYLADIRTMRPGETVEYDLVLTSNQPQTVDIAVESVSRRGPGGSDRVQTDIIP